MIEVQSLKKSFKKKVAVENMNFYLEDGESVGLLGPNGAGKSTAISMISTLMPPTQGSITYNGKDALTKPDELRKDLGVVPQEIALYEELSAYENMKFFGKVYGLSGKLLEDRIQEILKLVGLTERQKEAVETYSGGMKRRINLAVALMHKPKTLVMDEPTVGIDPQSRNYILDMVRNLNREEGLTVLYTSHYMEEVEKLCDRVYIMDEGRVIASGTKEELKSILSNEETVTIQVEEAKEAFADLLSSQQSITQVMKNDQGYSLITSRGEQLLEEIFDYAKQTQVKILSIHVQTPTLEDVFLHLTGRKLRD
ncbi:daunorubicin resistance protein DrrA family ABC transporter ATP-binding protein [Tetragenococcus muriaticus]|uniref:ATP-binding component of an ABC superfamily methionine transporter n=1 Tax=Tetragenococcus muriaticus 3MR10-3 TaxID=1302648 RepID=A0A091BZU6_9ENTE|nr:daunorubicin resistance protein DrrA family ABC transporter ATP-binding protein [Tetragenococcus muriaticus]KFN89317.1 ATP-binding component of an ABC superfamily methionine transporter [Tetragenococcus muriaticus 3MR10-3]